MFCIYCKGSHKKENCPVYLKAQISQRRRQLKLSKDIIGKSPGPFIGHYGYPNVNVGIMAPIYDVDNTWEYDAPKHWAKQNYATEQIMQFRSNLLNSRMNVHIKGLPKIVEVGQEISMAAKPADIEINLVAKPKIILKLDNFSAPRGLQGIMRKIQLTSNPHVKTKVERVISDTDLKAVEGISELYNKGLDETFIMRNLSIGNLGVQKNRKIVPTRWSITATDDTISKMLKDQIQDYQQADYQLFFGGYLGNYYIILVFPDVFRYELFETSLQYPDNTSHDVEGSYGRKNYAAETAGGYYACRLGILEKLKEMKRKATVIALRFITNEYTMPLGVWVCREATRKAMNSKSITFSDRKMMLEYAKTLIKNKFGFVVDPLLQRSELLKELSQQRKLSEF